MKKGKLLVLGLIALVLAGGLALASCEVTVKCRTCGRISAECAEQCGSSISGGNLTCDQACKGKK